MKHRAKAAIFVCAIIAILLLPFLKTAWFHCTSRLAGTTERTTHPDAHLPDERNKKRHGRTERVKGSLKPRDSRLNILFNGDDFSISPLKLENYLRKTGRNDKSLTAAYLLTGDSMFLKELHAFPDSPIALAMIAREEGGSKAARAAAQRLVELFPQDPQGHYWSACFAAKEGNFDAAVSAITKVNELPGSLDVLSAPVTEEMLNALGSLGHDKVESHAYLYHRSQWLQSYQSSTRDLSKCLASSLRDLPEEEKAIRAAAVIGLFQRLNGSEQKTQPLQAMARMTNERSILKMLPQDFGYGDSGTVADRLEVLKSLIESESQMMKQEMPALQQAKPETVDEYFTIFQKDGSTVAREWLLSKQ